MASGMEVMGREANTLLATPTVNILLIIFIFFYSGTPHILKFYLWYTGVPAAPQEPVQEAGIEPGTAALQSGVTQLP
jgi:ABC-type amino acid transport system permease subunit